MEEEHKCSECYWCEQCGCERTCEYFDLLMPDEDGFDPAVVETYINFLNEAHETYMSEVVDEIT